MKRLWQGLRDPGIINYMQENFPSDWTYGDFAKGIFS